MFYESKKNQPNRNAFMPPPERREFSTYRNRYANAQQCKRRAKMLKIGESAYCGLAVFIASHLELLNQRADLEVVAKIVATPLDEMGNLVERRIIYLHDKGTPFHADAEFDAVVVKGQPNTPLRQYAEALVQIADYYHDANPDSPHWQAGKLRYRKKVMADCE